MLPVRRSHAASFPVSTWPINRLDSLFDQFFGDDGGFPGQAWSGIPVAMWQDDDRVFIEAELPGVAEGDVDVTVHNGMLFIRGERKCEPGRSYLYNGRCYGRFERVISLPEAVDTDAVQAELTHGVLHVTLPKRADAKPKKIELKRS